ncbi:uncharacterized protein EV420DRAFT_1645376 [Desarmillaria tabescens]|uniref:Uncharacterized protein n=1 Tax=Armillaria tabescens TaxID=1929756 RepID=A0AA39K4E4_ARMTA|nr:uncharacterized protein EV420DRAFT_1645376 [Desarmillaria tabescens]KAK0454152.1 hypothetical protein EV420DRAFT_1645376 [Desarmillaria tabescens]
MSKSSAACFYSHQPRPLPRCYDEAYYPSPCLSTSKSKLDHGRKHSTCKPIAVHQPQESHLDRLDYRPSFPTLAEQGQIKCQLRNRLRGGLSTMTSLPEDFPFCHGVRKHEKTKTEFVSTDLSFEFQEVFNVSTPGGYGSKWSVVVSFSDPRASGSPFCWRIHYPRSSRNSMKPPVPIAQVNVHQSVIHSTSYGRFIRKDPTVILQALSMSLELGVLVNISQLSPSTYVSDSESITIIYTGTSTTGEQTLLHSVICPRR